MREGKIESQKEKGSSPGKGNLDSVVRELTKARISGEIPEKGGKTSFNKITGKTRKEERSSSWRIYPWKSVCRK